MIARRTGEVRLIHVMLLGIALIVVGVPILIFFGVMGGIAWLGLTKENMDRGLASAKGYTAAKTPTEAMDRFREAIKNRDYDSASYYCTKSYAEILKKSHANARDLGKVTDKVRNWGGNERSILSDKVKIVLFKFDPFPTNFKVGPAPKMDGDKKAQGTFIWEQAFSFDNPAKVALTLQDEQQFDRRMFANILSNDPARPAMAQPFAGVINLVKEGEEWKLDIPTSPLWETEVNYFNERCRRYQTAMDGFASDLTRERSYDNAAAFETDLLGKLRAAK